MSDIAERISKLTPAQRALLQRRVAESSAVSNSSQGIPRWESEQRDASFGQERLWFLEQIHGETPLYNIAVALHLQGALDVSALHRALHVLIGRHETLRTRYISDGGVLRLDVREDYAFELPVTEIESEESLQSALDAEARQPLALDRGLLLRARLFRVASDDHTLLVTMHHIASDGWSLGVFYRELTELYNCVVDGVDPRLPELKIRYSDHAHWMRDPVQHAVLEKLTASYVERLRDASLVLELPTDRPRPPFQTFSGRRRVFTLSRDEVAALHEACRREKVTPFMVLLASLYAVLHRYSGQSRILVGSAIAGRTHAETERLIGFFANTLILAGDLSGDPDFRTLLQRVRSITLDALAHQEVPFERVIQQISRERDLSRSSVFQVMFVLENAPVHSLDLRGLSTSVRSVHTDTSKFDLSLHAEETATGMDVWAEYNTDLFDAVTIERLWAHLCSFMQNAFAKPEMHVSEVPLLSNHERRTILGAWNATAVEYPKSQSLADLVELQVRHSPEAIAVIYGDTSISYGELNERANQLARELMKNGAGPETLVGVCLERGIEMMVALLAVMKTGAAYVPLDPALPDGRIDFMLSDSAPGVLITQQSGPSATRAFAGIRIDIDDDGWLANSAANLGVRVPGLAPAYVIYTSGSTGKPKGVQVEHRALLNLLRSMCEWLQLSAADRVLAVTTISFDIAGADIWLPWIAGATTIVATHEDAMDGRRVRALIDRHDITFLQATPATWQMLVDAGWDGKKDLQAVSSGEALPSTLASKLFERARKVWNMYGPTETTIWSTGFTITDPEQCMLIGRPVSNTQCYVLDVHGALQPIGVTGELYIGGDGVARGYLNQSDLTEEKFPADPFSQVAGARMYRTGDLVRYRADGNMQFVGRTDDQVKVRGFRIELGEIEKALASHDGVRHAVVVAREDTPGDRRLVAFVIAEGELPQPAELRGFLKRSLPDYMLPAAYVPLTTIPLTASGKIDRDALLEKQIAYVPLGRAGQFPRSYVELQLTDIWEELLHRSSIGVTDDFFELGGHSLLAVAMMERAGELFGCRPPLFVLFEEPTIQHLAQALVSRSGMTQPRAMCVQTGEAGRTPLFLFHGDYLGGGLYCRKLAQLLDPEQPLYVLAPHQPDGPQTIEEMALDLLPHILQVQPKGPYLIAGYCNGGLIALESARMLISAGGSVEMLAVIDSDADNLRIAPVMNTLRRLAVLLRLNQQRQIDVLLSVREPALRLLGELPQIDESSGSAGRAKFAFALAGLIGRRAIRRMWRSATSIAKHRATEVQVSRPSIGQMTSDERKRHDRGEHIRRAMQSYVPCQYAGTVTVIGAANSKVSASGQLRNWRRIAKTVSDVMIPGDHGEIVTVHISALAEVLRTGLAATHAAIHAAARAE